MLKFLFSLNVVEVKVRAKILNLVLRCAHKPFGLNFSFINEKIAMADNPSIPFHNINTFLALLIIRGT